MIWVSEHIIIQSNEYSITAVRSGGPGGQHVNKVATAVVLSFDIPQSSLPDEVKFRLLKNNDKRISNDGVIRIKSQKYRSQLRNKEEAVHIFTQWVQKALRPRKKRKLTRPSKASHLERLNSKKQRSEVKKMRKRIEW